MRIKYNTGQKFCEAMSKYIDSLMSQQDFSGVVQYFSSNHDAIENAEDKTAGVIMRQVAISHASLSNYPVALKTIRLSQNLLAKCGENFELAETFISLGIILRDSGELKKAEKAFRDAESIFRRNDGSEGQSRALNMLAGLYFKQNDFKNALSVLMDAVEIVRKFNDRKKLSFMIGNIGRIYFFTGNFAEAKKNLQFNIKLSEELNDIVETYKAKLSIGYVLIQEGNYDEAETMLDSAYKTIISEKSCRDEVICLTYIGELYYRKNNLKDSISILSKAHEIANRIAPDSTIVARVKRHLAEAYLRKNEIRSAERMASQAIIIMKKHNVLVEVGALLKIKALIANSRSKSEKTEQLFNESFKMLDKSGVRFEKVDALIVAAETESYGNRKRLAYLFRAEEFYSVNGLKFKLQEIGKLISKFDNFHIHPRQATKSKSNVDFLTNNKCINKIKQQLPLISKTDIPVLITGETGVGKDHLAYYFHSLVRSGKPFRTINCSSLPASLLESELFGFKKGAFTGADSDKIGLFVAANGGLLFLDEIGDMPLNLQSKLLGVLENRKVLPLGATNETNLDFILVAATNRNLEEMVESGQFRRDLYYRLSGITFHIPALRERKEDIPLLVKHFLSQTSLLNGNQIVPTDMLHQFVQYDWPGNTRELANKIKRLEIMSEMVAEGDLVEISRTIFSNEKQQLKSSGLFDKVEQFEKELIIEALLSSSGNKSEAARILGIHEATVRTKLKRYDIQFA